MASDAPRFDAVQAEKVIEVIEHLTTSHLDAHGGYPLDYRIYGPLIIIADLDDSKERQRTVLRAFDRADLIAWYDRAEAFKKANPDFDWTASFFETADESDELWT